MTYDRTIKRFDRVISDLNKLAGRFEDAAFHLEANILDEAADSVEGLKGRLVSLAGSPNMGGRNA